MQNALCSSLEKKKGLPNNCNTVDSLFKETIVAFSKIILATKVL